MHISSMLKVGIFVLGATLGLTLRGSVTYTTYTFSGTGTNGVTATGTFSVDSTGYSDGYFATGGIYQNFSLTISNITTGGGPSSVTFNSTDPLSNTIASTWLKVVGSDIYVGPQGEYDYVSSDRYWFPSSPTQPTSSYYETAFNYNLTQVSTISWSAAVAVVPEPATYAALAGVLALGLAVLRRRRVPVAC